MDISTNRALQNLDINKNDAGLTLNELRSADTDGNQTISVEEGKAVGIINTADLHEINQQLSLQSDISPVDDAIVFERQQYTDISFEGQLINIFSKLNLEDEQFLTRDILQQGLANPNNSVFENAFYSTLLENIDDIEAMSDDEIGIENDGITIADIHALLDHSDRNQDWRLSAGDFADKRVGSLVNSFRNDWSNLNTVFDKLNLNDDQFLSRDILQQAIDSPDRSQEEKAFLNALLERVDEIEGLSDDEIGFENDGISKADLNILMNDLLLDVLNGDNFLSRVKHIQSQRAEGIIQRFGEHLLSALNHADNAQNLNQ